MESILSALPLGAGMGVLVVALVTGVVGGLQYMADRRYVTKRELQEAINGLTKRLDSQDVAIGTLETGQKTQITLTQQVLDGMDQIRADQADCGKTIQKVLEHLQGTSEEG